MSSLQGKPVQDTYPGLLKTTDNAVVGEQTVKVITDGEGNATALKLAEKKGMFEVPNPNIPGSQNRLEVNDNGVYGVGNEAYFQGTDGSTTVGVAANVAYFGDSGGNNIYGDGTAIYYQNNHDFSSATVTGLPATTSGTSGVDGAAGTSGSSGVDGPAGPAGTPGTSGSSGTSGGGGGGGVSRPLLGGVSASSTNIVYQTPYIITGSNSQPISATAANWIFYIPFTAEPGQTLTNLMFRTFSAIDCKLAIYPAEKRLDPLQTAPNSIAGLMPTTPFEIADLVAASGVVELTPNYVLPATEDNTYFCAINVNTYTGGPSLFGLSAAGTQFDGFRISTPGTFSFVRTFTISGAGYGSYTFPTDPDSSVNYYAASPSLAAPFFAYIAQ